MPKIQYENRAVAFIDVLGFKTLVKDSAASAVALAQLQSLVDLLDATIPALNSGVSLSVPQTLHPNHLYISDCIILSAPLFVDVPNFKNYNGLEILVMRVSQITHLFMAAGYLVRGGVSVGKVWHGTSNVVGPAYQEAYLQETCTNMPRVELTQSAKAHWANGLCASSRMCIDYDGHFMVNGLHDYYVQGGVSAKSAFAKYEATALSNASNSSLGKGQIKWQWYLNYLQQESALI